MPDQYLTEALTDFSGNSLAPKNNQERHQQGVSCLKKQNQNKQKEKHKDVRGYVKTVCYILLNYKCDGREQNKQFNKVYGKRYDFETLRRVYRIFSRKQRWRSM